MPDPKIILDIIIFSIIVVIIVNLSYYAYYGVFIRDKKSWSEYKETRTGEALGGLAFFSNVSFIGICITFLEEVVRLF